MQKRVDEWLNSPRVSEEDKNIIRNLKEDDLLDAFFKDVEFGTAGMRGILGPGTNRLNEFTVKRAAVGFALFVLEKFSDAKEKGIVISHDNRLMSREFTLLSAKIFNDFGIKAYIFDSLRPTPELSFAVRYLKCVGGVMVTASHNPKEHNGYKVYDEHGCQLTPSKISRLVEIIDSLPPCLELDVEEVETPGKTIVLGREVDDEYIRLVENVALNREMSKKNYKIVYTPQHGASYEGAMRIFKDLGFDVYPLLKQCTPDPLFSETLSPNPEDERAYIEPLKYAKEIDADMICMTDPDGDRVGLMVKDEHGQYIPLSGNQGAALLIDYIFSMRQAKGTLSKDGVMYSTIVSSTLGKEVAKSYGIKSEEFLTGFKFIGDRIQYYDENGGPTFEFGYEESYGCLASPFARDKDGLQAILLYAEMGVYYHRLGKNLIQVFDELQQRFSYHSDLVHSITFFGPKGAEDMKNLMAKLHSNPPTVLAGKSVVRVEDYALSIAKENGLTTPLTLPKSEVVKLIFEDDSFIAVRPSGTEPKCKFYVGAVSDTKDGADIKAKLIFEELMKCLK